MKSPNGELRFSAVSTVRDVGGLFRRMLGDLLAARELGWHLMKRDLQARYRESFLGLFWGVFPPLAMAIGFTLAARARVLNIGETNIPYPVYIVLGMSLWQLFVDSLNAPVAAISGGKAILTKIRFPREALIIAKVGEVFFNFFVRAVLVVALFIYFEISPGPFMIYAPVGLLMLVLFGLTIGFLMIPMSVLFQDAIRGLTLLTSYWFFLTPIVYPIPKSGIFQTLVEWNPATPILVTARELIVSSHITYLDPFLIMTPTILVGLILAWILTYISMPFLIERMSA